MIGLAEHTAWYTLLFSVAFCDFLSMNPLIAALVWQIVSNRRFCLRKRNSTLFEKKKSDAQGETTMLQSPEPGTSKPAKILRSSWSALTSAEVLHSPSARPCGRRPASACVHSRVILARGGCIYCCRFQRASIFFFKSDLSTATAGGLFHFKTGKAQCSIKPEDYATKGILTLKSLVCKTM